MNNIKTYSWSRLQDFQTCPFMFYSKYIDKSVQELNPLMIIGRVVHNAINIYNRHCLAKGVEHDYSQWKECANLALRQENLEGDYYSDVLTMVKNYAESHEICLESAVGAEEEIAINRKFESVDWEAGDVWFRSIVDFLQIAGDVAKITDYKAGWLLTVPRFQFEIYAWIVSKIYPHVSLFEVELDFVRHEFKKNFIIEIDEIAEIEEKIMTKIFQIENAKEFKPKLGHACSFCGCWEKCPAIKREDKMFAMPINEEEAKELVVKIEKYEKLKKEATEIMKVYCDNKGAVIAGGKEYGFSVSNTWNVDDISEFLVKADELGVDLFDVLKVDNTKLKRRMKDELVEKLIREIGEKKVSVRFTSKKYKPSDDLAPEDEVEGKEDDKKN